MSDGAAATTAPTLRRLALARQHETLTALQRMLGNAAVRRLLQRDFPRHDLPMPGTAPGQPPTTSVPAQMDKQEFLNRCGEANTLIDNAYTAGEKWFLGLALAYGKAWDMHTETLKGQAEEFTLVGDLLMRATFAFIPGGMGGAIAEAMKKKGAGDFLADGAKDLWEFGVKTATSTATPALAAFPEKPSEWEKEVAIGMKAERLQVGGALQSWQHKVNNNDATFARDFDPVQVIDKALTIHGQKLTELTEVNVEELAKEEEKGMWTTWLVRFAWTNKISQGRLTGSQDVNVGFKIQKRCRQLGIDLGPLMAESLRERQQEYREWGKAHPELLE